MPDAAAVRVARTSESDWRAYRDIRLAALIDAPSAFGTTYAESAAYPEQEWRRRAREWPLWVAWDGERPVGTVALWHDDAGPAEQTHLIGMWVAGEWRGSGVAARLVDAAVAHAAASGFERVTLEVTDTNGRARAAYERVGFVPTGETETMTWDPGITRSTLALDLRDRSPG